MLGSRLYTGTVDTRKKVKRSRLQPEEDPKTNVLKSVLYREVNQRVDLVKIFQRRGRPKTKRRERATTEEEPKTDGEGGRKCL